MKTYTETDKGKHDVKVGDIFFTPISTLRTWSVDSFVLSQAEQPVNVSSVHYNGTKFEDSDVLLAVKLLKDNTFVEMTTGLRISTRLAIPSECYEFTMVEGQKPEGINGKQNYFNKLQQIKKASIKNPIFLEGLLEVDDRSKADYLKVIDEQRAEAIEHVIKVANSQVQAVVNKIDSELPKILVTPEERNIADLENQLFDFEHQDEYTGKSR